jgi:hypothetical protein
LAQACSITSKTEKKKIEERERKNDNHALLLLKKLDSRSKKGIFVGYNTNGYRIWDPNTENIYVSRDVTFTNKPVIPNKQQEMVRVTDPEDKQKTPDQQDKRKFNTYYIKNPSKSVCGK